MASFNPDTTIGAYQIGVLVSYVLFGVTTTQTYIYFSRFSEDSPKLKALVAFVWVCEVAHALCIGHTLYTITISDYMHPERLAGAAPISLEMAVLFHGIIASCGMHNGLQNGLIHPYLLLAMSFLRMLGDIGIVVTAVPMTALGTYEVQFRWLVTALWSVSTVNDFTITATLVSLLYIQRSNAQRRTAALVDKLIVWTIETGMLTSLAGLGSLAFFVAMPETSSGLRSSPSSPDYFKLSPGPDDAPRNERCYPAIFATHGEFLISGFRFADAEGAADFGFTQKRANDANNATQLRRRLAVTPRSEQ
ncbi:hypothetical protein B0H13DRAFT_2327025 [Mycena leptocephala]|nr:hypothetical protein B0H13DRAFT_2327025 [Mycena leptocephala]